MGMETIGRRKLMNKRFFSVDNCICIFRKRILIDRISG